MCIKLIDQARQFPLSVTQLAVLNHICDRVNKLPYCYGAIQDYTDRCKASPRTVRRALSHLEGRGLIMIRRTGRANHVYPTFGERWESLVRRGEISPRQVLPLPTEKAVPVVYTQDEQILTYRTGHSETIGAFLDYEGVAQAAPRVEQVMGFDAEVFTLEKQNFQPPEAAKISPSSPHDESVKVIKKQPRAVKMTDQNGQSGTLTVTKPYTDKPVVIIPLDAATRRQPLTADKIASLTSTRKRKKPTAKLDFSAWRCFPTLQLWMDWLSMWEGLDKKYQLNQSRVDRMGDQVALAVLAGYTVDDFFALALDRNWHGFKAQWLDNRAKREKALQAAYDATSTREGTLVHNLTDVSWMR